MKKHILSFALVLCLANFATSQVIITNSHVGLGENTTQSIPFHIKSYNGLVSTIDSPKSYFTLSQYVNPLGTANTIYHDDVNEVGALKFKSASNVFTFYTLDQEQARLDLNTNRFTVQKEVNFEDELSFGGVFRLNNFAGASGDLMMSLGNGTPAWSTATPKVPVGYSARKLSNLTVPNATDTDFTSFTESFDHEASLNFFPATGAFIAPSDGVYHFDFLVPYINYPQSVTNGRATLYVKKNNVIVDTMLKSFSGYGSNNQFKISMQMSVTLKLLAGDSIKFGMTQVNNLSSDVTVFSSSNLDNPIVSGFKVY